MLISQRSHLWVGQRDSVLHYDQKAILLPYLEVFDTELYADY